MIRALDFDARPVGVAGAVAADCRGVSKRVGDLRSVGDMGCFTTMS